MNGDDHDCSSCVWSWEVRKRFCVLVDPAGRERAKVSRAHRAVGDVLMKHEALWGAGSLDTSRQVTSGEAKELLAALEPLETALSRAMRTKEAP